MLYTVDMNNNAATATPSLADLKAKSKARADEIRKARAAEYRAASRARWARH